MECYFVLSLLGRGGEFSQTIDALLVAIFVVHVLSHVVHDLQVGLERFPTVRSLEIAT